MARPNESDMPPNSTKKVWLGITVPKLSPKPWAILVVTVIKSVWRPIVWSARRMIRVNKRPKKEWMKNKLTFFLTRLFGDSFSKFSKSKLTENLGIPTPLIQSECFSSCRQTSRSRLAPSSLDFVRKILLFLQPENTCLNTRFLLYR